MEPEILFDSDAPEIAGAYYTPHPADEIDNWEDDVLQAIKDGRNDEALKIIRVYHQTVITSTVCEALVRTLSLIVDSPDPRYQADLLAYCCGLRLREGQNSAQLAKVYGKSRTIVRRNVDELCGLLGLAIPDDRNNGDIHQNSNYAKPK